MLCSYHYDEPSLGTKDRQLDRGVEPLDAGFPIEGAIPKAAFAAGCLAGFGRLLSAMSGLATRSFRGMARRD